MATKILNNLDTIAVVTGGLFTGATLYIGALQLPAVRASKLNDYWRLFPYLLEKSIALPVLTSVTGVAGIVHGSRIVNAPIYRNLWIASGTVFLAIVPYSIYTMGPINRLILRDNASVKNGETSEVSANERKALVDKWNGFHIIRTVSAVVGFGAMVYGLSRHSSLVLRS